VPGSETMLSCFRTGFFFTTLPSRNACIGATKVKGEAGDGSE